MAMLLALKTECLPQTTLLSMVKY
uniref:Uncharacterized protein n=1 Tax=Rhizophora mucronata TaxID=61149 RepID=A0A2P2J4L9_RHIMU